MSEDGLFEVSDEERMLHQMILDWGSATLQPSAEAWDGSGELPASILSESDELGLNLISLSEERGGVGLGLRAALRSVELVARFEPSLALRVGLANGPVARCAPEGLEGGVTWAHGALQVTEDGAYGALEDVPWSEGSRWVLVPQGERLYAVDLHGPGVHRSPHSERLGLRCAEWANLYFEGARVLASPLSALEKTYAEASIHLTWAALAIGIGARGAKLGMSYAQERVQFGKPITSFQAIQWMIADSETELDAARLLTYASATALDEGDLERGERLALEARLLASEAGHQACDRGLQMHGGYGYTREYHVERAWRDVQRCFPTEGRHALSQRIAGKPVSKEGT